LKPQVCGVEYLCFLYSNCTKQIRKHKLIVENINELRSINQLSKHLLVEGNNIAGGKSAPEATALNKKRKSNQSIQGKKNTGTNTKLDALKRDCSQ
jgi:hypothetical protein